MAQNPGSSSHSASERVACSVFQPCLHIPRTKTSGDSRSSQLVSSKKKPLVAEFTVRVRALQVFPAVQKGKPWAEKEFQELPAVEDPHTSPVVVTKLQGSAAPGPRVPQSEWPVLLGRDECLL